MFRITGFIVGSALVIAAMLIVFGMPQLPSSAPEPAQLPAPLPAQEPVQEPDLEPDQEPEQEIGQVEPLATKSRWHSFWSPFGSQIAANGFVSRLEAVTGYDYRVIKIETGIYEVAFAYVDEAERLDKISVIALATGLELPES